MVEVNPVVDETPPQADGWRTDALEQGPADGEIARRLFKRKAARLDIAAGTRFIVFGHDVLRLSGDSCVYFPR